MNSSTGAIFSLLATPFAARDLKGVLSLSVYYLFKNWAKNCLCINRIPKMMSSFVVQDLNSGIEAFSCHLLLRIAWIDMNKTNFFKF